MNIQSDSLITRLTGYFLILSLLTVIAIAGLSYTLTRESLYTSVVDQLSSVATLKEGELNRWLADRRQDVVLISRLPEVQQWAAILLASDPESDAYQEAYEQLSQYLLTMISYKSDLQEIFIMTDVGGQVILSTSPEREGEYRVTATYFTQGRLGTYVQNVYPSPVTGKPTLTIGTPLTNEAGEVIGVMGVHLNLDRMNKIILERAGLGPLGETYLVDRYNAFVSEARFGEQSFPRGVDTEGINAALSKMTGDGIYENYEGVRVVGVYRWLEEHELALLAEIAVSDAIGEPSNKLAINVLVVGSLLAGIMALVIYYVVQRMTGPLLLVTEVAEMVAAGDLKQRIPVVSRDEVGVLARTFNQMTERLYELYEGLEQKVQERTQALEARSRQLEAAAQVARESSTIRDVDRLLRETVNLISERFDFYHAGIFLLDEAGEYAVLQAASSEGGQRMLARGHKLRVGQVGIVGAAAGTGSPRIALDVGEDSAFFNNPDLPLTHSEMALPLTVRGRVIGVLDVQSQEMSAFSDDDISILQTMADQVALAIENARLLRQSELTVRELRMRYADQFREAWDARLMQDVFAYHYTGVRVAPASADLTKDVAAVPPERPQLNRLEDGGQELIAPIRMRDQTLGAVVLRRDAGETAWTSEDLALVETTCDQIALALDNARLIEDTQARAARERMTGEISSRVRATATDVDTVLRTTLQELGQALGAMGTIHVLSDISWMGYSGDGNGHEE